MGTPTISTEKEKRNKTYKQTIAWCDKQPATKMQAGLVELVVR